MAEAMRESMRWGVDRADRSGYTCYSCTFFIPFALQPPYMHEMQVAFDVQTK